MGCRQVGCGNVSDTRRDAIATRRRSAAAEATAGMRDHSHGRSSVPDGHAASERCRRHRRSQHTRHCSGSRLEPCEALHRSQCSSCHGWNGLSSQQLRGLVLLARYCHGLSHGLSATGSTVCARCRP